MNFFKQIFSKPLHLKLTVTSSNGFHLRPVAKFVSVAKTFSSSITAMHNTKEVSAKAVNALLSLGLDKGDTFTLILKGKDAKNAKETLQNAFLTLMKNDSEVKTIQKSKHHYTSAYIEGESIHSGIIIAPLYVYEAQEHYAKNDVTFQASVAHAVSQYTLQAKQSNEAIADIYLAQKELLLQLSQQSKDIETLSSLVSKEIASLQGTKLESKAVDYQDLLRLVKTKLGYSYSMDLPDTPSVLMASDLLPSDIAKLDKSKIEGVILTASSLTSHTAILLRSAGIPSLLCVEISDASSLDTVILDTYAGLLIPHPSKEDIAMAMKSLNIKNEDALFSYKKRFETAFTKTGATINVYANVTDVASAKSAKEEGAEGIGLLRTEFLFTEQKPSLEIQTKAYAEIFAVFSDVTVRTLDVGGDKALPYVTLPKEDNPFLGVRGVRLLQTHPTLLAEQLQAIFMAAQNKPIKVMFPMVSSVDEFTKAKDFAKNVAKEHHIAIDNIRFGMMIEVPSVLFSLPEFDKVVDFYSVGTNDLTQYLFAIERTHPTLKTDTLSPIVFTVLESIVTTVTKPVSICGELASNKAAIERLISLGIETLSVTPKIIAQTKETIRSS